jgi:hypothetical protein
LGTFAKAVETGAGFLWFEDAWRARDTSIAKLLGCARAGSDQPVVWRAVERVAVATKMVKREVFHALVKGSGLISTLSCPAVCSSTVTVSSDQFHASHAR